MSQALPPGLEALIDQALLHAEPDPDDRAFLDALVEFETAGELTREQAETLAAIVGYARASDVLARAFEPRQVA